MRAAGTHHFTDYLKQVVFGGNDGIVTTFAIVAGFAGAEAQGVAGLGALAVLIFGLANLTADAVSMGLGEFLSGRSNRDLFRARHALETNRIAGSPEAAAIRMAEHLKTQGLSPDIARHTADHLATSPTLMADLVLRYEYGMEAPDAHNLRARALMTFLSFIAFGAIPLLPFVVLDESAPRFAWSVAATGAALVALGLLRFTATGEKAGRSVAETVLLGGLCAVVAYLAGMFVAGLG
ncbi:VIT1/CCC1 transporter family protein [uncultured Aliiroseovarius sp.]|nr:VIT1/CCC1 transporter family protein [uncultured Aliiroseovarius sp.]